MLVFQKILRTYLMDDPYVVKRVDFENFKLTPILQ